MELWVASTRSSPVVIQGPGAGQLMPTTYLAPGGTLHAVDGDATGTLCGVSLVNLPGQFRDYPWGRAMTSARCRRCADEVESREAPGA